MSSIETEFMETAAIGHMYLYCCSVLWDLWGVTVYSSQNHLQEYWSVHIHGKHAEAYRVYIPHQHQAYVVSCING